MSGGQRGHHIRGWRVLPVLGLVVLGASAATLATSCAESTRTAASTERRATPRTKAARRPDDVELATPAVSAYTGPPRGFGAMGGVRATRMTAALANAGLDIAHLPPLESLDRRQKQRVMRTFSETLGVPCTGCHADEEFYADTRRKRVAKRMWNELVRVVAMKDGAPIYCDSCHDGALFHLDRRDPIALASYMCDFMIGKLRRIDGRPHDCTTCHGDPPSFRTIAEWKASPAPDIVASDARADGSKVQVPSFPLEGPRTPSDCGPQDQSCPLQGWMRSVVTPAYVSDDREKLAQSLERIARYAPELTAFGAIATAGANAARRGDAASVKASCADCHRLFKADWRAHHRTRAAE